MQEIEEYEHLIDERYSEVFYNGCFEDYEDPCDYINNKEVITYVNEI